MQASGSDQSFVTYQHTVIKELKAENDALKSQLKGTDARLSKLKAMVETILAQQDNSDSGSDDLAVNR